MTFENYNSTNAYNPSFYGYPCYTPFSYYKGIPRSMSGGTTSSPEGPAGSAIQRPAAHAQIIGGPLAPRLTGFIYFYDVPGGTYVCVSVSGLPEFRPASGNIPQIGPHGFHIHQFGRCEVGDPNNPFQAAGEHWNPTNQPHGNHAGDFPALFSNRGEARMCFFTNKFRARDVIGKSVIIHMSPDDYRTQPAGNSGKRLGCGVIR